jgi:hypothetical protein
MRVNISFNVILSVSKFKKCRFDKRIFTRWEMSKMMQKATSNVTVTDSRGRIDEIERN